MPSFTKSSVISVVPAVNAITAPIVSISSAAGTIPRNVEPSVANLDLEKRVRLVVVSVPMASIPMTMERPDTKDMGVSG